MTLTELAAATTTITFAVVGVRYVAGIRPVVPRWILLLILVSTVLRLPRALDEGDSFALVLAGVVFGFAIDDAVDEVRAWRYRRALARSIALHPSSEVER